MKKFIDKVGAGLLPSRLNEVLPDAQAVLRMVSTGQVGEGWTRAERKLQKSLRKFRCCRELADKAAIKQAADEKVEEVIIVSDTDAAETGPQPEEAVLLHVDEDDDLETTAASEQHLQLVSKMNEWGFLDDAQRVERVQQAEAAARRRRKNVSQEELAEVINTAAAALAAPRRRATRREVDSEGSEEAKTATQPQGPKFDLQRRVRALLLDALKLWRTKQYDRSAIAHVLDFVQMKISKFEDNVGEIGGAAAGKAWLSIKDAVEEMLQGVSAVGEPESEDRVVEAAFRKRRLERQSGIRGINWDRLRMCWRVWWFEAGKRPQRSFPATNFLKQGLSEEEAVEAALQEVKAFRQELERQGKLQPPKLTSPAISPVRGVAHDKESGSWKVQLTDPSTKKRVHGGSFQTQEEAEAKAQEMGKKLGLSVESGLVPVRKFSELRRFEKLGPQKGVKWDIKEQCWHARCTIGLKHKHLRARPKDFSKLEVEKSWNQAVAWRQQQEQLMHEAEHRATHVKE